ncbi:MAG: DUF1508 domain-containing protein [Burkholderiales bacterium]|nr:DUF1508 domain-containing protein [Burkholderiales bacterium]
MAGKYEVYKDKKGEYRFRLKAGNGQSILTGEGYASRGGCDNGIASIRTNSVDAAQYERKEAKNGKHYFVLKAKNHQVIGQSEMYNSEDAMENGIKSAMENGPTETVEDLA